MRVLKPLPVCSLQLLMLIIPVLATAVNVIDDKIETVTNDEAPATTTAEAEVARLLEEQPRVRGFRRGAEVLSSLSGQKAQSSQGATTTRKREHPFSTREPSKSNTNNFCTPPYVYRLIG